jgi:hypothetical protein
LFNKTKIEKKNLNNIRFVFLLKMKNPKNPKNKQLFVKLKISHLHRQVMIVMEIFFSNSTYFLVAINFLFRNFLFFFDFYFIFSIFLSYFSQKHFENILSNGVAAPSINWKDTWHSLSHQSEIPKSQGLASDAGKFAKNELNDFLAFAFF